MGCLSMDIGGDLNVSPRGGFGIADGDVLSRQRVMRRLVTCIREVAPNGEVLDGDYLFDQDYGTRLGRMVGASPTQADLDAVEQSVRIALAAEDSVSQVDPPVIQFTRVTSGLRVVVSYVAAQSNTPVAPISLLIP